MKTGTKAHNSVEVQPPAINKFEELSKLNVNERAEKKSGFTYLSWAWAWAEFVKIYPEAKYEVIKNESYMPYFKDESGAFCYTRVTAGGLTHEMWLPVMDYKNKTMTNPTAFDVNKTIMRCLTKNLAMFGLGLYIYAGEDLPKKPEISLESEAPTEHMIRFYGVDGFPACSVARRRVFDEIKVRTEEIDSPEAFQRFKSWTHTNFVVYRDVLSKEQKKELSSLYTSKRDLYDPQLADAAT